MLTRPRNTHPEDDQGFTLIELLVVIIIIGILAAIAVPLFLNQQKKGVDASLKSDLRSAATSITTLKGDRTGVGYVPNIGGYGETFGPLSIAPRDAKVITEFLFTGSPGNVVKVMGGDLTGFCVKATNPEGTDPTNGVWYDSSAGGIQKAGTTACPTTYQAY